MAVPLFTVLEPINGESRAHEHPALKLTDAERAAGVTPVNYAYKPGHVYRYGTNSTPGTTDMTAAINAAATVARNGYPDKQAQVFFEGDAPCFVSGSLDFSLCDVYACGETIHIQASSSDFHVITTTGSTRLFGLRVHGGWNGSTAGLTGDIVHASATPPAFPYVLQFENCTFTHAKRTAVYISRSGYTSIKSVRALTCGLHALQIQGTDLTSNTSTTVQTSGRCQWSSCPNGYGIWIEYGVNHVFTGDIIEDTKGIWIGGDNRMLSFIGLYQEFISGSLFLDWSTSSGIGLKVVGCFGGSTSIPYNGNWVDVSFDVNSNLGTPAIPLANRILNADGGQLTTSTTGGTSVTATSIDVFPGVWMVFATVQTLDSSFSTISQLGIKITTNSADSGLANTTGSGFAQGCDEQTYNPGTSSDLRCSAFMLYQNTTASPVTVYLRAFIKISAGTIAYRGQLTAVKVS